MNAAGHRREERQGNAPFGPLPARLAASAAFSAVIAAGLLVRLAFLSRVSLSGDEAVFGLMSFAIVRGEDYPLYCWGAHYASALISYLGIISMAVFGATAFGFKAATLVWNLATLILIPMALRRDWGTTRAVAVGAVLAIVPPRVLEMSVAAHGGYPETFFLGPALWLVSLDLADRRRQPATSRRATALLVGFLAGASFAILWLGVPFLLAAAVLLTLRRALDRTELLLASAGALAGSLPFWIYNIWLSPASTFRRLGGRSLAADAETPIAEALTRRIVELPVWLTESGQGLAVLFEPHGGLAGFLILIAAAAYGIRTMLRDPDPRRRHWAVLVLVFGVTLLCFNVAGNLARPRHWTPLWLVLPFALVGAGRRVGPIILFALALVTLPSTLAFIRWTTHDPVIREAAALLETTGADGLIADYDLGYPITFENQGRIPVAAVAPPNSSDRRPSWTREVERARRPAALLLDEDADRLLPHLVAAGFPFRRDDLGSRVLIRITGSSSKPAGDTRTPAEPYGESPLPPGAWLMSHVLSSASADTNADIARGYRADTADTAVAPLLADP